MARRSKEGIPEGRDGQCESRLKTCRNCTYRFKKGDTSWYCKECGESRRCENDAVKGSNVCNVHGAKGGRPPGLKFKVAEQLAAATAAALANPKLLSLHQEIALMMAMQDQLMERLEKVDVSAAGKQINNAADMIDTGMRTGDMGLQAEGMVRLRQAMQPLNVERSVYYQLIDNMETTRKLVDTERKWSTANKQMMEVSMVLDLIILIQRIMFKYIPSHRDRAVCAREILGYLPSRADITIDV